MALTREQLEQAISTGNFDVLIGEVEGLELECKLQPYQVQTENGKRELAKDVSSLANTAGGYVVIGAKTKTSATHFGDEVEEIRPFDQALVDTSRYTDLLRSWVYPEIAGLTVLWIPVANSQTKGLVVIGVPRQDPTAGPFLITKTIDGAKQVETVFGYASRKGDRNPPLDVKELQRFLRSGFHYQQKIEERMDVIEALLKRDVEPGNREKIEQGLAKKIAGRLAETIKHGKLKDTRTITISAQPRELGALRTLFSGAHGSIKRHLEQPPTVRDSGWSMVTLDQARIVRGEMARVTNGDRTVLDLYRDGTMIFAASADRDFLAWGKNSNAKINPLALIEVVYSFMTLYELVLADFADKPSHIMFGIGLLNVHLDGAKSTLAPYGIKTSAQMFGFQEREAPDASWSTSISIEAEDFDPAVAGYDLVRELYLWFGFDEDVIPYVKDERGTKMIDAASIASA